MTYIMTASARSKNAGIRKQISGSDKILSFFKSILFILLFYSVPALADETVEVRGGVFGLPMQDPLIGATVKLFNASDSTLVLTTTAESSLNNNGEISYFPTFVMEISKNVEKYILSIDYPGYDTFYMDLDKEKLSKGKFFVDLGKICLSPEPESKNLSEVVVNATKIKFYNKGDTIVYNADAFNLPEGSMLDALIRQLPDVKLTQDGEIFVAGKKVQSLLLDGKDFFDGNNQIMLDNLGAYTVKDIKVYEKYGFESEVAGRKLDDMMLVMDVKLKKEFMVGLMGNLEGGYGTHDRYLARIFAGTFTPLSRFALYANFNNVNSSQSPQQDTDWRPETMPTGTKRVEQGGVKYGLDSKDTKWYFYAGADASNIRDNDGTDTYRTNFLAGNDTYDNSFSKSRSHVFKIENRYIMKFKNLKGYGLQIVPDWSYERWNRNYEDAAATFSEKVEDVNPDIIGDIYNGNHDKILKYLINRNIEMSKLKGYRLAANVNTVNTLAIPGTSDQLTVTLDGNYSKRKDDRFERFNVNFGDNPVPSESADRYYKNHPDFNSRLSAKARYLHYFNRSTYYSISYNFEHKFIRNTSDLYRLDMADNVDELIFGTLPSYSEYAGTIDPANSYVSKRTENYHLITPRIEKYDGKWDLVCEVPVRFARRRINYIRGNYDTNSLHNDVYLDGVYLAASHETKNSNIGFHGTVRGFLPDLLNMVEITDDTDPLNIRKGNPDLKKSMELSAALRSWFSFGANRSLSINFEYREMFDAIGMGYVYDTKTGVRTSSYYNVDGNRSFNLSTEANIPLTRMLSLRNTLNGSRIMSVDLIGTDSPLLSRSKVNSWDVHENLYLSANIGSQTVYARFDGGYRNYSSPMPGFTSQDTWTFQTGVGTLINLPFNFQLSTDFSIYNRRGFTDNALNTDNYVWNARLTYKAFKGKILFMADGYDILRNLSNVSYTINAQARTEMVRTVLPSYFMFHIQWKFNKSPGNRK